MWENAGRWVVSKTLGQARLTHNSATFKVIKKNFLLLSDAQFKPEPFIY